MGILSRLRSKLAAQRAAHAESYPQLISIIAEADAGDQSALPNLARSLGVESLTDDRLVHALTEIAGKLDITLDELQADVDAVREAKRLQSAIPTESAIAAAGADANAALKNLRDVRDEFDRRLRDAERRLTVANVENARLIDAKYQASVKIRELEREHFRAFGLPEPVQWKPRGGIDCSGNFAPNPPPAAAAAATAPTAAATPPPVVAASVPTTI